MAILVEQKLFGIPVRERVLYREKEYFKLTPIGPHVSVGEWRDAHTQNPRLSSLRTEVEEGLFSIDTLVAQSILGIVDSIESGLEQGQDKLLDLIAQVREKAAFRGQDVLVVSLLGLADFLDRIEKHSRLTRLFDKAYRSLSRKRNAATDTKKHEVNPRGNLHVGPWWNRLEVTSFP